MYENQRKRQMQKEFVQQLVLSSKGWPVLNHKQQNVLQLWTKVYLRHQKKLLRFLKISVFRKELNLL